MIYPETRNTIKNSFVFSQSLSNFHSMKYFVFLLFLGGSSFAQLSDNAYLLAYKDAVQLYANHQFDNAKARLSPLTGSGNDNPVVPYALYYHALCSYELSDYYQSRVKLRDLFTRFPDWEKIDEARYLYVLANFKENYFDEAFSNAERIDDQIIKSNLQTAEEFYIKPVKSIELLKSLNEKFPNEKIIAETLVHRIQEKPYNTKQELQLSDLLTNRYKLKDTSNAFESGKSGNFSESFEDGTIDIGVFLPFDLKNGNVKTNQYVFDLYAGMKIAAEELKTQNKPVNLVAFDVGKETEDFGRLKSEKGLGNLDVFIGPLYPGPNKEAEAFAMKNKIIQVHPLSNNIDLITDTKTIFLAQSSFDMQASKALTLMMEKTKEKTVSIYFGKYRKDSIMAASYKSEALKLGFKILEYKKFISDNSIGLSLKSGHVFFTGDEEFGSKIIRTLGLRNYNFVSLVSTSGSFNFDKVSRNVLQRELFLIYPDFVDYEKDQVKTFKKAFQKEMNMIPSYYAYLGYDIVIFYSKMLMEGKEIFRLNMNDSYLLDEFTLCGFDYSGYSNDNKKVPVVKFNEGHFEVQNN